MDEQDSHLIQVLRPSMFTGIPPFINFVPAGGCFSGDECVQRGPQYWDEQPFWDQDQLWRFTVAFEHWVEDLVKSQQQPTSWPEASRFVPPLGTRNIHIRQKKSAARAGRWSVQIRPPFRELPDDAKRFMDSHPHVKFVQFPRMLQICKKDLLAKYFKSMRRRFGNDMFGFHPVTFILPEERQPLLVEMAKSPCLWIVKPPHANNGTGVYVISGPEQLPENAEVCVQQYITNPLLIQGHKFDIRVYVLLTSFDPLRVFMYDDGLVRIATEQYTEDVDKISDCFIHVCNMAVNVKNSDKFVYNNNPDECKGHKWRLKCLWSYLIRELGFNHASVARLQADMKHVVVKTVLAAHADIKKEFVEMCERSCYNSYRLIGYDLLVDADLKVHLVEVNARPQLSDATLDKAVNRPLLDEMLRIVGYHIPHSVDRHREVTAQKLKYSSPLQSPNLYQPFTFEPRIYSRFLSPEDCSKQERYSDRDFDRAGYLDTILQDLTTADVRMLVKSEEELSQVSGFQRLLPSAESHIYLGLMSHLSYYDKLLDAYEHAYGQDRLKGIRRLQKLCDSYRHL